MAQTTEIKLAGADRMAAVLRKLPDEVQRKVVLSALRKSAVPIRDTAKALAPRGETPGGKLRKINRAGTTVNYGTLFDNIGILTISKRMSAHMSTVIVWTRNAFWGLFQERATARPQRLKPFLGPAFSQNKERALSILGQELAKGIERAAKKLAGK